MKKVVLFALNADPVVFAVAMLNALDMKARGWAARLVIEADATKFVGLLRNETKQHADIWRRLRASDVEICVCKACAVKNTVEPAAREQNLALCAEMGGHVPVASYVEQGYEVLVF